MLILTAHVCEVILETQVVQGGQAVGLDEHAINSSMTKRQ